MSHEMIALLIFSSMMVMLLTGQRVFGAIGFVGLIVPHLVRLAGGTDHRVLIPVSVMLGGSLLIGADLLSRTLIAPRMMPVGVFTTLLGVPLFLYLIRRQS